MKNDKKKKIVILTLVTLIFIYLLGVTGALRKVLLIDNSFRILSNSENKEFNEKIKEFGKQNRIDIEFTYADDLEIVDILNGSNDYDAIWMSNSTWIYMASKARILNSKSTNINPVVFGIKKSKAESLGFVNNDVYNKDIINAIRSNKLKYVMSSVTKTNTGLISYFGFLNALSGSPEILTSDMLKSSTLVSDLKALFSGVQRVSGSDDFLNEMFLKSSDYEAVVATESALISINKELESSGKEPLYLIYPVDGVAINDSPFAYIDHSQDKLEVFNKIQSFILSDESQKELEKMGRRTWYGGVNVNADSSSFKKSWGIDTSKYLIPLKYPSKSVMDEAIELYLDELRKPSITAFCLDVSGSMYGNGEIELKSAMNQILDYETAKVDKIQFSSKDKIYILPFSDQIYPEKHTNNGRKTTELINYVDNLNSQGGTNIYGCAQEALELIKNESDDYTKTVILMTDGQSNVGTYYELAYYYNSNELRIPIYSITFGSARESELRDIAELTNAKVFDGRTDLTKAFKEVRSYN